MPFIPLILIVFFTTFVALALKRVPDGEAWTVHRLGRHVRTLRPGLRLVFPGLDRISRHVSLIGHHVAIPVREFAAVEASADLYYQILDPVQAGNALESTDDALIREAGDAMHTLAARMPAQTGWSTAAADALKQEINRRVARMGLRVIRCALHTT
jgi:regulator of protease activity HflC (stomatin/prohibitin superfamily)